MDTFYIEITPDMRLKAYGDNEFDLLMESKEVGKGFGVDSSTIRAIKSNDMLLQGDHWVTKRLPTRGGFQETTVWTREGILKIGLKYDQDPICRRFTDTIRHFSRQSGKGILLTKKHCMDLIELTQRVRHGEASPELKLDIYETIFNVLKEYISHE